MQGPVKVDGWVVGQHPRGFADHLPAVVIERETSRVTFFCARHPRSLLERDSGGDVLVDVDVPASVLVAAIGRLHCTPAPDTSEASSTSELVGKLRKVVESRLDDLLRGVWSTHDELVSLTGVLERLGSLESIEERRSGGRE